MVYVMMITKISYYSVAMMWMVVVAETSLLIINSMNLLKYAHRYVGMGSKTCWIPLGGSNSFRPVIKGIQYILLIDLTELLE